MTQSPCLTSNPTRVIYLDGVKDMHHLNCVSGCLCVWDEVMRNPLVINMHCESEREREGHWDSPLALLLKSKSFLEQDVHPQAYDIIKSNTIRRLLL